MYALWHCQRQGWITSAGITSTDFKKAAQFQRYIAIARCGNTIDHEHNVSIVPVLIEDMEEVFT